MKQLKEAIKNNAILLTIIDLILMILYLLLIKKLCNKSFEVDLYDLFILWIMIGICYSKNKSKEMLRIIGKILEKENDK